MITLAQRLSNHQPGSFDPLWIATQGAILEETRYRNWRTPRFIQIWSSTFHDFDFSRFYTLEYFFFLLFTAPADRGGVNSAELPPRGKRGGNTKMTGSRPRKSQKKEKEREDERERRKALALYKTSTSESDCRE